ncbi:MAG: 3-methyl-2-oxobutanoate hydroxymethyltransferase [Halobacteriovoraceae bacterium]|nr:3-methyl-2-oxobutanoate hydroxymethyltransferase [Halobacteriovoraceae bacterium]|tara:strand:+ start:2134 stop:2883 length:750 start_codon:yes stop_codon:yes gene_type:complete
MKKTVRSLQKMKQDGVRIQMLTCYDFQMAAVLNQTELDLILVGDSVGNVVLGYDTTVEVSLEEMQIFGAAVRRGAPEKFVVVDMPFGSYASMETGLKNAIELYQSTKAEALKLEGANQINLDLIKRLTETGIAVMGHIGLQPQSVHAQGGYFKHGKEQIDKERLMSESLALQEAGCFAIVLEFVEENLAQEISKALTIPTIGIGSGVNVDGQVLVINDLLGMGENAPGFVKPIANLFQVKKLAIEKYLQ